MERKRLVKVKQLVVICVCVTLCNCSFLGEKKEKKEMSDTIEKNSNGALKNSSQEIQETIDDYTDTYTITPKYGDPKFKELIAQFNKQEHRFKMDACEFRYNGQSFFIGDSAEKIKTIFGEPNGEIVMSLDKTSFYYDYDELGLSIRFSSKDETAEVFLLKVRDVRGNHNDSLDIVMFRKIPYHYEMKLNQFLELSDLDHDKLRHTRFSFLIRQKECAPTNDSRITTRIASDPVYESKGVGHLNFTGDFDPTSSNKINGFEFSIETLEDIKQ